MEPKLAHSHSLRNGRYSESGRIYFVTSCCHERHRLFQKPRLASILIDVLADPQFQESHKSLAFVAMPDHIHWLVQLTADQSLSDLVRAFKGRSARRVNCARQATGKVWQAGFHDHALRAEEDLENVANYLIHNPVRAGIAKRVDDYAYWRSIYHGRPFAAKAAPTGSAVRG